MPELEATFESNIIPIKTHIHDCQDTGTLQAILDGVRTPYTNDCVVLNYNSGVTDLWETANNRVINGIQDSSIDIVVGGTFNATNNNMVFTVELEIDSPTPILVRSKTIEITRAGVDIADFMDFPVYNGTDALLYGFKIWMTPIGGGISITDKTILVRV